MVISSANNNITAVGTTDTHSTYQLAPAPETLIMPMIKVAIVTPANIVDIALPLHMKIFDILPTIEHLLSPDDILTIDQKTTLGSMDGTIFDDEATIASLGIIDGDMLLLRAKPIGTTASPVIEDIADIAALTTPAITQWNKNRLHNIFLGQITVWLIAVAASALLYYQPHMWAWWQEKIVYFFDQGWRATTANTFRWEDPIMLGNTRMWFVHATLICIMICAAIGVYRLRKNKEQQKYVIIFASISYVTASIIIHNFLVAQPLVIRVCALATLGFLWNCILAIANGIGKIMWTTLGTFCGAIAIFSALTMVWDFDPIPYYATMVGTAFILISCAGSLGTICARLPISYLPAPGEPFPSALSITELKAVPQKIDYARAYSQGFVGAAVLLHIVGALGLVINLYSHRGYALPVYILVIITTVSMCARHRLWQLSIAKLWLMTAPNLLLLALGFFSLSIRTTIICYVLSATYCAGIYLIFSRPKLYNIKSYPIITRRIIGMIIFCCDCVIIPLALYLIGVFQWALYR